MEIFISWSGNRSGACAKALRDWLPCVIQSLKPWCSSEDVAKGSRGGHEIAQTLGKVNFGIVCLTPSNLHNEWIHFESGVLSNNLDGSALFTLLLDLQPIDIKPPPGHFQHTRNSEDEFHKMLGAINQKSETPLAKDVLDKSFEAHWLDLETSLRNLPSDSSPIPAARPQVEILEEILTIVRGQGQRAGRNSEQDGPRRRANLLLTFADGLLKGRNVEGKLSAAFTDDTVIIGIVPDFTDTKYELEITASKSLAEAKASILKLVEDHTVSDADIPF